MKTNGEGYSSAALTLLSELSGRARARIYGIMTTELSAATRVPRHTKLCDCVCGLRYVRKELKGRKSGGAAQCECGLVLAAWSGGAHYVFVPAEKTGASFRVH